MLLEGQLTEVSDELELLVVSTSLSPRIVSTLSDDEDDSPPPPPLQEITRRLKINTIRKKRSFFISSYECLFRFNPGEILCIFNLIKLNLLFISTKTSPCCVIT